MSVTVPEESNLPLPFVNYPQEDLRKSIWIGNNCRHGYGLALIEKTNQSRCGYCNRLLTGDYYGWLTMAIDHVVPISVCKGLKIDLEFCRSLANMVLVCAACNGFDNRYKLSPIRNVSTFEEFLKLRDEIFIARRGRILKKHKAEEEFFTNRVLPLLN